MFPSTPLEEPLSVRYVTQLIRDCVEGISPRFTIEGELSNVRLISSGHLYFNIKDQNDEAMLQGAIFAFKRRFHQVPKDGDLVIIQGRLSIYAQRSTYQIIADTLIHSGIGRLMRKLEEIKKKLAAEHCFDADRKKPLPPHPKRICVVTSPTGAVIHDILRVLSRRTHAYNLLIYPVSVQGDTAAYEIATAIQHIQVAQCADVIIIARGGGSFEDLWAFNEEVLVRAVASCSIPIISAIGHETDYTLCDLAADVRAPTPSAAAEIVCKDKALFHAYLHDVFSFYAERLRNLLQHAKKQLVMQKNFLRQQREFHRPHQRHLRHLFSKISVCLQHTLDRYRRQTAYYRTLIRNMFLQRLSSLRHLMHTARMHMLTKTQRYRVLYQTHRVESQRLLEKKIQFLSSECSYKQKLLHQALTNLSHLIHEQRNSWRHLHTLIQKNCIYSLQQNKAQLRHIQAVLASLNPRNVIQRGYAMLFNFNKTSVILSAKDLQAKDRIKVALKDGEATVIVDSVQLSSTS